MSDHSVDRVSPSAATALSARMAEAEARARRTLGAAIDDLFVPDSARLDDRTRAALGELLAALVATVEAEVRDFGARLLEQRGAGEAGAALADAGGEPLVERLARAGLLRDPDFMAECIARVRLELLAAALPAQAPDEPEAASLLVRLTRSTDRVVASAASALLTAESARRAVAEGGAPAGTGLPAELHHRLVWWVAAAARERLAQAGVDDLNAIDRAVAEAALRALAAHDAGDRLEAAAMRLAVAIDARADELPVLATETLRDRRPAFFVALVAHALGVAFELVRELTVDSSGERLWLVLRALELPRDALAEIGYRLAEADPRRDVEAFADMLDALAGIDSPSARVAVAPLKLHPEYRAALHALEAAAKDWPKDR